MPVSVSILSILCLVIMLLLIPHIIRTNRKGLASFKKYYKKAGIPIIQINIQGKDCFMILDTGSFNAMISLVRGSGSFMVRVGMLSCLRRLLYNKTISFPNMLKNRFQCTDSFNSYEAVCS